MMPTKPKTPPLYKAGDWIVNHFGQVTHALHDWTRSTYFNYVRHATVDEIEAVQTRINAQREQSRQREAFRATQPYQDAASILCLDEETLIAKLGAELLHEIAERLRQ